MTLYVNSRIYSHVQQLRVRRKFVTFSHERDRMHENLLDFNISIEMRSVPLSFQITNSTRRLRSSKVRRRPYVNMLI